MGKNLQNILKLIHRLRHEANNKNVIESKNRTSFFNVNSIKVVIHYFCLITKLKSIKNVQGAQVVLSFYDARAVYANIFTV